MLAVVPAADPCMHSVGESSRDGRIAAWRHLAARAVITQNREHLADSAAAVARDEFAAARQPSARRQRIVFDFARIAARIRGGEVER